MHYTVETLLESMLDESVGMLEALKFAFVVSKSWHVKQASGRVQLWQDAVCLLLGINEEDS